MSANGITLVGMDAHKKAINVAMLLPEARQPVEWLVANEPGRGAGPLRQLRSALEARREGRVLNRLRPAALARL